MPSRTKKSLEAIKVEPLASRRAFAKNLIRARGRVGLTQDYLASPNLSKSFISLLETGRSEPSVETVLELAGRSGASVGSLLLDPAELHLDTALSLVSLARAAAWNRPSWAVRLVETAEQLTTEMPLLARVEIALVRSVAAATENRLDEANRLAHEALQMAEEDNSELGRGLAMSRLGHVAILRREFPLALRLLSESVATLRKAKGIRSEAGVEALILLGTAAFAFDQYPLIRRVCRQALLLATRLGLTVHIGRSLTSLGIVDWAKGDMVEAFQKITRARQIFEEIGDLPNLSLTLNNLGLLYRETGDIPKALAALKQSIQLKTELGHIRPRSTTYEELALLYLQNGDLDEAEHAARQALNDANQEGDRQYGARAQATLGRVMAAKGRESDAIRFFLGAATEFKELGLSGLYAETARDLVILLQGANPEGEAAQYLVQALTQTHDVPTGIQGKIKGPQKRRGRASRKARPVGGSSGEGRPSL